MIWKKKEIIFDEESILPTELGAPISNYSRKGMKGLHSLKVKS